MRATRFHRTRQLVGGPLPSEGTCVAILRDPRLRRTEIAAVYRATRDLFLAQRFARHASPLTTVIYTHPSDQEMYDRLRGMEC